MVQHMSICRNQMHPKFRLVWTVIKTPSSQTCQVPLWKMSNKAQKQRQAFCFLVACWYSGCRFGVEGTYPFPAKRDECFWPLLAPSEHCWFTQAMHLTCNTSATKLHLKRDFLSKWLHSSSIKGITLQCAHTHTLHTTYWHWKIAYLWR